MSDMRPKTHNGFTLRLTREEQYDLFPASRRNEITYEYFCLMGGLSNDRCHKIERPRGGRTSYHRIDLP